MHWHESLKLTIPSIQTEGYTTFFPQYSILHLKHINILIHHEEWWPSALCNPLIKRSQVPIPMIPINLKPAVQENKIGCALRVGGIAYSLSAFNHIDMSQSWLPVSSCIQTWVDSTFLQRFYTTPWCSMSSSPTLWRCAWLVSHVLEEACDTLHPPRLVTFIWQGRHNWCVGLGDDKISEKIGMRGH